MWKFLILILVSFSVSTNVKKCKNGQPFPLSVIIEGCTDPPCNIIKGSTAIMRVHFVGTKGTAQILKANVRATTFGITIPYILPDEVADICANLMYEAICPIYETEDVVYQLNFFIDSIYPEVSVAVEVSLNNENDDSVACFVCNIKVMKGPTNSLLE